MKATTAWLPRMPSAAATGRVFCIPHAGSGAAIFGNWPDGQDSVEFLPVELPGRLTRFTEPMPETFEDLADALIEALRPYLDIPFAFFGHCWSALAAYEVTARIQRADLPLPARLFVSSQVAPQDGPVGRMLGMDDAELRADLERTIRDSGKEPHPELVSIYADVLRADVEVSRRYIVPDPLRLSCPITAIGWSEDTEVDAGQMTGWAACGEAGFELLPGRHHRFLDAPPELLSLLRNGVSS
ncbi:thioesterase II family protein [Streptomyces chartreusis]|uniref:thioesterase II family protein n=1 Tax=Streptomyces chartreusis TaxID=1969 RepID=UPI0036868786